MAILIHTIIPAAIAVAVVLLGRKSQKQFALGAAAIFLAAVAASLYSPNVVIVYKGPEWASGYSTWATAICSLFAIALIAIWRGFGKPAWGALAATLLSSLVISSMGYWQA
jgi:drug/metabolite transporter (DMT)-like permease